MKIDMLEHLRLRFQDTLLFPEKYTEIERDTYKWWYTQWLKAKLKRMAEYDYK